MSYFIFALFVWAVTLCVLQYSLYLCWLEHLCARNKLPKKRKTTKRNKFVAFLIPLTPTDNLMSKFLDGIFFVFFSSTQTHTLGTNICMNLYVPSLANSMYILQSNKLFFYRNVFSLFFLGFTKLFNKSSKRRSVFLCIHGIIYWH